MSQVKLSFSNFLLAAVLFLVLPAFAQYGASIQGTVQDKSGAVVAGASVEITNQATAVRQTTNTSDSGFYRVAALTPGRYKVVVSADSFKTSAIDNVGVEAETVRGLNVTLEPGGTQETVVVTGQVAGVETENANISEAITTQEILRLPQYGRDPYELVRFAPGVFGDGARTGTGGSQNFVNTSGPGASANSIFAVENVAQVSANGQRPSGNNFTVDGTSVNSLTWGGAAVLTPNQESIAEVNVISSSYSAEDGRNTGAQIKAISKTGTNQFHGSGFFTYDEPGLNAYNSWGGYATDSKPQRVNNKNRQFGGSVGGPVVKDKLFFFFSYEGNRVNNRTFVARYLPTPEFLNFMKSNRPNAVETAVLNASGAAPRVVQILSPDCNDFKGQWPGFIYSPNASAGTQGADGSGCQLVPGGLDLGGLGLTSSTPTWSYGQYVPLWNVNPNCAPGCVADTTAGGFDGIPDVQKALLAQPTTFSGNQYNTRIDFYHGKNQFAGSFYITPLDETNYTGLAAPNQDVTSRWRNGFVTFLWNRTFSPTLLNEARFNATRWHSNEYQANSGALWGLPHLQVEAWPFDRLKFGMPQGDNAPGLFAQNQFEFRDVVSKSHGRHGLKAGFSYDAAQDNTDYMFGDQRPIYVYHSIWELVNGAPIYEGVNADPRTGNFTDNHKYFRQHDIAWFAQDDIKLRPNLTINLGLRYEYFSPLKDKNGQLSNLFLSPATDYINGLKNATLKIANPLYPSDKNNFGPRVGFAWSPASLNNKGVFRGGFGLGYNRVTDTMTGISRVNPPFVYRYGICCAASALDLAANGWMQPPYAPNTIGNQIAVVQSQTGPTSITGYPGNPALATNPQTGLPNNSFIEIWGTPQNFSTPYAYVYSTEFQYELPRNFVATLGYQGSSSHRLLRIVNLNNIYKNPSPFANVEYFPSPDANANYNALLANLSHRFSHGIQMFAKYRWSKSIDDVTGEGAGSYTNQFYPINQSLADRGPSDFDTTHNLQIIGMWDVPFPGDKNSWAGRLLGGWHVDPTYQFHSGFPWSAVSGANCPPVPQGGTICPALPRSYNGQGGTDYSNSTFQKKGGNFPLGGPSYFDISAPGPPFVKRNSFRGPRYQVLDVSLGKETHIPFVTTEGARLDFRANFFNAFNKLDLIPFSYNTDSTNIQNPRFGEAGGALAGRVIEFQTRLTF
jgi:hypothetical protein